MGCYADLSKQELSSSSLGSVVVGAVGKARRKKVVQASKTHQFHPFQYCRIYVRLNPYEAYFLQVLVTTAVLCRTTRLGISFHGGAARHFLHRFGFEPLKNVTMAA